MSFCVVKTQDSNNGKPHITIAPTKWVDKDFVYWPLRGGTNAASQHVKSAPGSTKRKQKCQVLANSCSYQTAQEVSKALNHVLDRNTKHSKQSQRTERIYSDNDCEVLFPALESTQDVDDESLLEFEDIEIKEEAECNIGTEQEIHFENAFCAVDKDKMASVQLEIQKQLTNINSRLERMESSMDILISFMADIRAYIKAQPASQQETIEPIEQQQEDFSEFTNMGRIRTVAAMEDLDLKLQDPDFDAKFVRYLKSIFSLNGKRDGKALFRMIVRKLIAPGVLIPFTWKGAKLSKEITSFRDSFPHFINTMGRILKCADSSFTREDTESAFSNYLRQKNTELKRFTDDKEMQRMSCSRKRTKRKTSNKVNHAKE